MRLTTVFGMSVIKVASSCLCETWSKHRRHQSRQPALSFTGSIGYKVYDHIACDFMLSDSIGQSTSCWHESLNEAHFERHKISQILYFVHVQNLSNITLWIRLLSKFLIKRLHCDGVDGGDICSNRYRCWLWSFVGERKKERGEQ